MSKGKQPLRYPAIGVGGKSQRIHRIRAVRALGRPLPPGAEVHHPTSDLSANCPLVICQDRAYHALLHKRARIRAAGGDPDRDSWCSACRKPRPMSKFYVRKIVTTPGRRAGILTTVCKDCRLIPKGAEAVQEVAGDWVCAACAQVATS
jgi:hypothetical protein